MKGTSKKTTEPVWEFFDLQKDPKELNNAIDDSVNANVIAEMKTALWEERKNMGIWMPIVM